MTVGLNVALDGTSPLHVVLILRARTASPRRALSLTSAPVGRGIEAVLTARTMPATTAHSPTVERISLARDGSKESCPGAAPT